MAIIPSRTPVGIGGSRSCVASRPLIVVTVVVPSSLTSVVAAVTLATDEHDEPNQSQQASEFHMIFNYTFFG